MVYKYLLDQIHFSDSLFFISCAIACISFGFKKLYGHFLWIGFNCVIDTEPARQQFTFYHQVTIDLKFPIKVAVNYFSVRTY